MMRGDDPGAGELVPCPDPGVRMTGRDHDFIGIVQQVQTLDINQKQPVAVRPQLNFAFLGLRAGHMLSLAEICKTFGSFILVEGMFVPFPNEQPVLAHRQQNRNILFRDDVALAELRVLHLAGDNSRQVMAEHMPDRMDRLYACHTVHYTDIFIKNNGNPRISGGSPGRFLSGMQKAVPGPERPVRRKRAVRQPPIWLMVRSGEKKHSK